ncbi:MAG: DUF4162 domain-containing protein, partial [Flavobacterium sp.]
EILELKQKGATIIFSTHRMESVEELCDDIALIHKSNKLIDGKLNDIKLQFRTNTFKVGIITPDIEKLMFALTQKYKVDTGNFKSIISDIKLEVQLLEDKNPNNLLSLLLQHGNVTHFEEKIPSANDIFIHTVTQKN